MQVITEVTITAIEEGKVMGEKAGERVEYPCDYAVMAVGSKSRDGKELEDAAEGIGAQYMAVGDAVRARRALNATREAFDAAMTI